MERVRARLVDRFAQRPSGHYRVRTGAYRAQLPVLEDVVIVVKVGHRDRFYES
jgi:mRNA-degrading endonuclease RelE of RelBE toxin-antitoxin system